MRRVLSRSAPLHLRISTQTRNLSLWLVQVRAAQNECRQQKLMQGAHMKEQRAREILQALVQGVDPFTGEELPPGTILQEADVLRALLAGVMALEQTAARAQRRAQLPDNVGRSWTSEEEATLVASFKSSVPLAEIATRHGRTVRAIEARLERLGLITPEQRSTDNSFVREDAIWDAPGEEGLFAEDASRSQPP
jgi:hypothetical protein